jgi:hypothetical protein
MKYALVMLPVLAGYSFYTDAPTQLNLAGRLRFLSPII